MATRGEELQGEIFDILSAGTAHLSAYDILSKLRGSHPKIAPPTVYRALSALCEAGRVHRVESANAYVACQCSEAHDSAVISVCDDCGDVEENVAPDLVRQLAKLTGQTGFDTAQQVIEVKGRCADCADTGAPS